MIVKKQLFLPKHLLLHLKKSIKSTIIFWIYSPFGVIKKVLSDLFFLSRGEQLVFYFYLKTQRLDRESVLTQTVLLSNAFIGISRKFRVDLWLKGVGFKFRVLNFFIKGKKKTVLNLALGFSHLLCFEVPVGCTVSIVGKKKLFFNGICFQELTQFVAYIQSFKLPDPYKGKGLNYKYKVKILKPGKTK
jgi:ribosomal protein L6P/L9E